MIVMLTSSWEEGWWGEGGKGDVCVGGGHVHVHARVVIGCFITDHRIHQQFGGQGYACACLMLSLP